MATSLGFMMAQISSMLATLSLLPVSVACSQWCLMAVFSTTSSKCPSVNYRVGPFGFLALEELGHENNGTFGNAGLQDQTMGLQWVRGKVYSGKGMSTRPAMY